MFGKKEPPASEQHFRKWEQTRSHGKVRFVLTRVLIAAGCEILTFFLVHAWRHERFDGFWKFVLGKGIVWLIGGYFAGLSEWGSNEKRYQRERTQFSSPTYDTPEQTLKQLQRGIENGR